MIRDLNFIQIDCTSTPSAERGGVSVVLMGGEECEEEVVRDTSNQYSRAQQLDSEKKSATHNNASHDGLEKVEWVPPCLESSKGKGLGGTGAKVKGERLNVTVTVR